MEIFLTHFWKQMNETKSKPKTIDFELSDVHLYSQWFVQLFSENWETPISVWDSKYIVWRVKACIVCELILANLFLFTPSY